MAFVRKKTKLLEDLVELQRAIEDIQAEMKTVDQAVVLLGIDCPPGLVRPKKKFARLFGYGERKRLVLEVLEEANGKPLTTRQIADKVMYRKNLIEDCRPAIGRALKKYNFAVHAGYTPDGHALWVKRPQATKPKAASSPKLRVLRSQ